MTNKLPELNIQDIDDIISALENNERYQKNTTGDNPLYELGSKIAAQFAFMEEMTQPLAQDVVICLQPNAKEGFEDVYKAIRELALKKVESIETPKKTQE